MTAAVVSAIVNTSPPRSPNVRRVRVLLGALTLAIAVAACAPAAGASKPPLRIGAIFPLSGSTAADAGDEYRGVTIAADMINAHGGVHGRSISIDVRTVTSTGDITGAVESLKSDGVPVVIGAYSSQLSIPAAAAVARAGMVYWETGAVADQVTGQGSPLVFRVGADGADLGGNSGRFVVEQLVPRLQAAEISAGAFLVTADDAYAHSVADGARAALGGGGVPVAGEAVYNPYAPDWGPVIDQLRASRPSVLLLSSHVPDGVAFRRAFLSAGLTVQAFIGTTMAQCSDFGAALGADAVGVFASDRPEYGFNEAALTGTGRTLYGALATAWQQDTGRAPTEEAISGFSSADALFASVLPQASQLTARAIADEARATDMPTGSLPNGAGVHFSSAPGQLGQNSRAAADIWQWQAPQRYAVVWPAAYATGRIEMRSAAASPSQDQQDSPSGGW